MHKSTLYRTLLVAILFLGGVVGCSNPGETVNENDALLEAALTDFYTSQDENGMATVESILETEPDNASALALRSLFKLRQDEGEAGFADANRAIEIDPEVAIAYVARAWYYEVYQNDLDSAQTETEHALELDPELAITYANRGAMRMYSLEDYEGALEDFERAVELAPNYTATYRSMSWLYLYLEDYEASLKAIEQAIEISPELVYLYSDRGDAHFYSGNYEAAKADYTYVIEQGEADAYVYSTRAYIYSRSGNQLEAIADYESAIPLDPENADLYNNAAYLIALSDGDLEKALNYVNKALELMPEAESKLDTQAYIYYKMGDYDKAMEIFSALVENGHTYSYYGRGLTYEALNEIENAISDLQAYLDEYPDNLESDDARQHLENLEE